MDDAERHSISGQVMPLEQLGTASGRRWRWIAISVLVVACVLWWRSRPQRMNQIQFPTMAMPPVISISKSVPTSAPAMVPVTVRSVQSETVRIAYAGFQEAGISIAGSPVVPMRVGSELAGVRLLSSSSWYVWCVGPGVQPARLIWVDTPSVGTGPSPGVPAARGNGTATPARSRGLPSYPIGREGGGFNSR